VYLVEFEVWDGHPDFELTQDEFRILSERFREDMTDDSISFQNRLCERSGLGDKTHLPPWLQANSRQTLYKGPVLNMDSARKEIELVVFPTIDKLFKSTKLKPSDIDILIVNCSLFVPTPSISSMIINHYKMKHTIKNFNLGGMGCSAGVISIDLAKDLLQVHKNSRALVVSTENITLNWYRGNEKGMLLQNSLFRCGAAAVLLSNRWIDSWTSKFQLLHIVRTHKGSSDAAYGSVYQKEDPTFKKGIYLSKELMNVVGDALKTNMTALGPLVLPWTEQIRFFITYIVQQVYKYLGLKPPKSYVPDFKKSFPTFLYSRRR
jgi:3-ketoacyl-CoA synthase